MKMVKSLLLGSAAGLVAAAGAQAADLPVKAKPVEYVRVCSLYGAGFWYVPGTDTCLKIGSYVRVQTSWDAEGGGIPIGMGTGGGQMTRSDTNEFNYRTRASMSVDLRTQTEYGTLRSYIEIGAEYTTATASGAVANVPFFDRGFIQFAGFTAGRIRSYFDINSFAPYSYSNSRISGDTGATGIYGIAYTAQFGNGITASLSVEDAGASAGGNNTGSAGGRGRFVVDASGSAFFGPGTTTYDNGGTNFPDVVGALRIDQAWGYAQVAAALHEATGAYYGTDTDINGHPGNKTGWAVTGGFTLNDVLGLKGDQFGMQVAYSEGAAGYVTRATAPWAKWSGDNNAGFAWVTDGVFDTGTGIELTTVWGINGFYQHFWNPKWRTSLWGGYVENDYNSTAKNIINSHLPGVTGTVACGVAVGGSTTGPTIPAGGGGNSCSPDSSWWQVGTRTQWNPHPDLDIGLEVLWTHLNTAYKGPVAAFTGSGARPSCAGACAFDDQDSISAYFRIQRNFLP